MYLYEIFIYLYTYWLSVDRNVLMRFAVSHRVDGGTAERAAAAATVPGLEVN